MTDTSDNKKKMLEALEATAGIVTDACERVGISRDTHYRWMRTDSEYQAGVESIENVALDLAESKLLEQIEDGNITAIIFFLKTKGKHRGYVQKVQEEVRIEERQARQDEEDEKAPELDLELLSKEEVKHLQFVLGKARGEIPLDADMTKFIESGRTLEGFIS